MRSDPRLDVLQAAVVAMAAALRPDQAAVASNVLRAGVADLEDRGWPADGDAAAACCLADVLQALRHSAASPHGNLPMGPGLTTTDPLSHIGD